MPYDRINSSEIDAYLRCMFRELSWLEPAEAAAVTVTVLRRLVEHLRELGVEVELSTKSMPE